jgi:hypothetical protein
MTLTLTKNQSICALNMGLMQGMVASADHLGTRVAAPNIGLTRLGAWLISRLVGWLVGWSASQLDCCLNGLESLEATLNAHAQPAMPTPMGDAGAQVTVPPGNAVIGDGSVGWWGGRLDGRLVGRLAGQSDGLGSLKATPNAPVQHTMPTPTGNADARVTVPPRNAANSEGDNPPTVGPNAHTPCMPRTEDELWTNNPLLQIFTEVDWKLHGIFGDTIHHNNGRPLDGGIGEDEDCKWQRLHECVVVARLPLYSLPNSLWAKQLFALQTARWRNIRLWGCNFEKAYIFAPLILRWDRLKKTMSKVKMLVWSCMDAWEASCFCALVKKVEKYAIEDGFPHAHPNRSLKLESVGQRFNSMVHSGKLRAAVRAATDHNPGGLYAPNNVCTKMGLWVLDIIRKQHPGACIPKELAFDDYANSAELLEAMPIACYKEQIFLYAVHLSGGAGPCGVNGTTLKEWLLHHEVSSKRLQEVMAHWVVWLSNGSPPFSAYRAVNLSRMLAGDKKPGVRPLACGEIWMRLWADCLNSETKVGATTACGNVNLYAGLHASIEGNLHAVRAVWPQSAGWERDGGEVMAPQPATKGTSMAVIPTTDPGKAADTSHLCYVLNSSFRTALFDARNGFNEVNRYLMLWTVASWFAFNRYRHQNIVFVCDRPGKPPITTLSRGGHCSGIQPLHEPLWYGTLAPSQEDA